MVYVTKFLASPINGVEKESTSKNNLYGWKKMGESFALPQYSVVFKIGLSSINGRDLELIVQIGLRRREIEYRVADGSAVPAN